MGKWVVRCAPELSPQGEDLRVDFDRHLDVLRSEGERLVTAASRPGFDAAVPTCPGWTVRDLVRHVGGIHRWAGTIVREARPRPFDPFPELESAWPADEELLEWFREGHRNLVQALSDAPASLECFTLFKAESARAFWARRQAHETGMHRSDAESASGAITPFGVDQAVDGIDELLFGFLGRAGSRLKTDRSQTLWLHADDDSADQDWTINVSADEPRVSREAAPKANCRVAASASDLFLFLWNRIGAERLQVEGDAGVL